MNEIKRQIKIAKWDKVITALLAVIIGVLFIVLPDSSSDVLCAISGIVLMVAGVVAIVAFASYGFFFSGHALISGIALLLAGLFCIVNPNVVKDLLTVIFGIFIVIDGSTSIADSIECARAHVEGWVGMLILSVVTVVLGGLVMFGPFDTVMIFAGISLIIDGICDIIMICVFSHKVREAKKILHDKDDVIYIADGGVRRELMPASDIRIPGAHNVYNMMMAAAVVQGYASDDDIRAVATTFGGVEHRIEFVREKDGVKYYNDSIASSPTRTIAGLNSFQQKVILIAGGYDKHIPYDVLGQPICDHVKLLLLTGATAPKIRECVENIEGEHPPIIEVENLETAVQEAAARAESGDVVIMSPASASFDRFKNFMERGKLFKALVEEL